MRENYLCLGTVTIGSSHMSNSTMTQGFERNVRVRRFLKNFMARFESIGREAHLLDW
jgi:hypothetical protein